MKKLFFLFLFFNLCIRFGYAQAWYVDARNTTPPYLGTFEDPWPSFSWVCCSTSVSGTVNVAPGLYAGSDNLIILNNRSNLIIKYDAAPTPPENGPEVILDGNFDYEFGVTINSSSNITIQGLRIQKFRYNGIKISGTTITPMNSFNINIIGCKVENTMGATSGSTSFAGIFVERTKNCLIQNCYIKQMPLNPNPVQTEGIYAQACENLIITKNYIYLDHQIQTIDQPHIDGIQVTWEKPTYTNGTEISDNIIINLGSDTQQPPPNNHYRGGISLARTNGNILIKNNNIVVPYGKDLINAQFHSQTLSLKIYNNTLVSLSNPTTQMEISNGGDPNDPKVPPDPGYPDRVHIKNNIMYKSGGITDPLRPVAIVFNRIFKSQINPNLISYNLFYYKKGTESIPVKFDFPEDPPSVFWDFKPECIGRNEDPKFVSTAAEDHKYNILYESAAKNLGVAFPEITTDILGNARPYWGADYDAGAYEIEDTQLKLGAYDQQTPRTVIHTLTAFGNFWERTPEGTFFMSENYALQSATESSTGNFDQTNLFAFPGLEYNWLDRSHNSNGKKIAAGFYRVTNDLDPLKFMYVDLRDKVSSYTLNSYLRYNNSSGDYQYYNKNENLFKSFLPDDPPLVRIWEMNGGTFSGEEFWQQGLVVVKSPDNHPLICWLPYSAIGTFEYIVERSNNCYGPDWEIIDITTNEYSEDTTLSFCTAVPPQHCDNECVFNYKVTTLSQSTDPYSVSLLWGKPQKNISESAEELPQNFLLEQNYPNPFNPVTNIRYSLSEGGLIKVKIYDILGQEVSILINEYQDAGNYEIIFNASSLSSGTYICRLITNRYTAEKKLQLMR